MPPLHSVFDGLTRSERSAPKTALSFFMGLDIVFGVAAVGATAATAGQPVGKYVIPGIWLVFALFLFLTLGVVACFLARDPTKLLLGQVDTRELIQYRAQQITLGDSEQGERTERIGESRDDVIEGTAATTLDRALKASSQDDPSQGAD